MYLQYAPLVNLEIFNSQVPCKPTQDIWAELKNSQLIGQMQFHVCKQFLVRIAKQTLIVATANVSFSFQISFSW